MFSDPSSNEITIKPVTENERNYVCITNDGLVTGVDPNGKTVRFIDSIFKRFDRFLLDEIPNTRYLE